MTKGAAIRMLEREYDVARKLEYVKNPLAYALYQVWKKADAEGEEQPKETDLTDKCGSCKYSKPYQFSPKGRETYIECTHPDKVWRYKVSKYKQRTNPKCKKYEVKQ